MSIAIPINGENLDSDINRTFGRTKQFILVDASNSNFKVIDNEQNLQATQGAGIQSSQLIIKAGCDVVVSMHCGPKAHKVLSTSGVKVYQGKLGTIRENIDAYKTGELEEMTDSNVEGHWV